MDKMTKETFIERIKEVNPFYDRIEFLTELNTLTSAITFRCNKHDYEKTCIARRLTKAICCPECRKEAPKREPVHVSSGDVFGILTVLGDGEPYVPPNGRKRKRVHCLCECGNEIDIRPEALTKRNGSKSCGCLQKKVVSELSKEYNEYDLSGEYGIGYTANGYEFYFDLEDYNKIKDYCWNYDGLYIITHDSKTTTIRLHKLLMLDETDEVRNSVDHKNGNRRDNRRSINLRPCTYGENACNTERPTNTGWQGVTYKNGKYITGITKSKKRLEYFEYDNLKDAVNKRIELEEKYYGEFSFYKSRGITYSEENISNF